MLDNAGALLTESRRLGPHVAAADRLPPVIESGVLTGEPEAPEFPTPFPRPSPRPWRRMWIDAHDPDRERDLLDRLVVDGEFLELDDGTIVPPDGFEPIMAGPKWNREVVGYKIGTASRARTAGLRYVGDRPMGASRALPWIAPALPPAAGLLERPDRGRRTRSAPWRRSPASSSNAQPRPDHRVGWRAVGLVDQGRDGGSRATADPLGGHRIGPVPADRRGSEAHPDRPGRNVAEI